MTHIPRIGIGGPVGSGKSMLIERLVPMLAEVGYSISIISNDVISKEDADRIRNNLSYKKGIITRKYGNWTCYRWMSTYCS